jgi:cell division protein FtsA
MSGFNLSAYVHIVMADINAIRNINKCVEIAGYKIEDIILEPIASSFAVLNEVEKTLGSILIDIGGGTTDIAVFFKDSIRFSGVIPLGGTNITQDLSIGLPASPNVAEEIKVKYGNVLSGEESGEKILEIEGIAGREPTRRSMKYISEIIEARMREILEKAYEILNENTELKMITAGLTLTGGASLLKNTDVLAEEIFNKSTKIGYPDLSQLSGPTDRLENPKFATSVGILYKAFQVISEGQEKIQQFKSRDPFMNFLKKIIDGIKDYF